jgi:F-type H+-transporting ATPase subunit delta
MTEPLSVARPYAKAAFQYASNANQVQEWQTFLDTLATVVRQDKVKHWLGQPHLSAREKIAALRDIVGDDVWLPGSSNFIALLIQRQRLSLLTEILMLFLLLKSEQERIAPVVVSSAYELSDSQLAALSSTLEQKLNQKVNIQQEIDQELLGGVLIQAGDLVFDYSIKGRLGRLADSVS